MSFRFNVRGLRTERVRADQAALAQVTTRLEHLARDQAAADALLAEAKRAADDIARETQELRDVEQNLEKKLELSRAALVQECLSTLPDDVLRCIFLVAVNGGGPRAPFALAAVCARWRRIALENSLLWSEIRVICPGRWLTADIDWQKRLLGEYARAKLLLTRSRLTPLSVTVFADGFDGDEGASQAFVSLIQLLGGHVSRWKIASLRLPSAIKRHTFHFLKGPTPLLEDLCISCPHSKDSLGPDPGGYIPFAPRLKSLAIRDVLMGSSGRSPYPLLKTLDLGDGACAEGNFYSYLRVSANSIEKLALGFQLSIDGRREAISFPRLRHLVLGRSSMTLVSGPPSSAVTASALRHLELDIKSPGEVETIASFLDTVASTVRKLTLVGGLTPELNAALLSVLSRLGRVEELAFRGMMRGCIHNDALELLTTGNPPVWPNLTHIKNVRYSGNRIWSSDAIFRFIESRNMAAEDDAGTTRPCKLVEFGFTAGSPGWFVAEVDRLLKL